jgi:Arc/MetJ family transcription regulator
MTRLSISVDAEMLEEVLWLAKVRTKRAAIDQAPKEFVRHHQL